MRAMSKADSGPLFRAENVSKQFRVGPRGRSRMLRAVDGISLTLARGETLGIVGESGSGKSTLARCLTRLIEPSGGAVFYRDQNLLTLSPVRMRAARRHIQMIFQDPYASLHPRRTVGELIAEPWHVHPGLVAPRDHAERVAALLGQVGLPLAYAAMFPSRLSGGERQRVAIARALALRPEVLILDEPVSALDVSVQAQVVQLLMHLQQELGLAYIFVSHDLALVRLVATHVAVMYMGRIVEQGPAREVYANPVHPYTRALLEAAPDFEGERLCPNEVMMGDTVTVLNVTGGCQFRTRCWKARSICEHDTPALLPYGKDGQKAACHFAQNEQPIFGCGPHPMSDTTN
jgi:oligopeptide/dipeptide ABC transporter ATP-binding protein